MSRVSEDAKDFMVAAVEAHIKGILQRVVELSILRIDVQRYKQK